MKKLLLLAGVVLLCVAGNVLGGPTAATTPAVPEEFTRITKLPDTFTKDAITYAQCNGLKDYVKTAAAHTGVDVKLDKSLDSYLLKLLKYYAHFDVAKQGTWATFDDKVFAALEPAVLAGFLRVISGKVAPEEATKLPTPNSVGACFYDLKDIWASEANKARFSDTVVELIKYKELVAAYIYKRAQKAIADTEKIIKETASKPQEASLDKLKALASACKAAAPAIESAWEVKDFLSDKDKKRLEVSRTNYYAILIGAYFSLAQFTIQHYGDNAVTPAITKEQLDYFKVQLVSDRKEETDINKYFEPVKKTIAFSEVELDEKGSPKKNDKGETYASEYGVVKGLYVGSADPEEMGRNQHQLQLSLDLFTEENKQIDDEIQAFVKEPSVKTAFPLNAFVDKYKGMKDFDEMLATLKTPGYLQQYNKTYNTNSTDDTINYIPKVGWHGRFLISRLKADVENHVQRCKDVLEYYAPVLENKPESLQKALANFLSVATQDPKPIKELEKAVKQPGGVSSEALFAGFGLKTADELAAMDETARGKYEADLAAFAEKSVQALKEQHPTSSAQELLKTKSANETLQLMQTHYDNAVLALLEKYRDVPVDAGKFVENVTNLGQLNTEDDVKISTPAPKSGWDNIKKKVKTILDAYGKAANSVVSSIADLSVAKRFDVKDWHNKEAVDVAVAFNSALTKRTGMKVALGKFEPIPKVDKYISNLVELVEFYVGFGIKKDVKPLMEDAIVNFVTLKTELDGLKEIKGEKTYNEKLAQLKRAYEDQWQAICQKFYKDFWPALVAAFKKQIDGAKDLSVNEKYAKAVAIVEAKRKLGDPDALAKKLTPACPAGEGGACGVCEPDDAVKKEMRTQWQNGVVIPVAAFEVDAIDSKLNQEPPWRIAGDIDTLKEMSKLLGEAKTELGSIKAWS
jgi:hypothetical protein